MGSFFAARGSLVFFNMQPLVGSDRVVSPIRKGLHVLLSWLNFGTWDLAAAKMFLKFTGQILRAPPGYFLAELLAELRRDCLRSKYAWLLGALRLLSLGLSFRRSACLVARVDSMLERIRDESMLRLVRIFGDNFSTSALREARSLLAERALGPYQELRALKSWVGQDGNPAPLFRVRTLPLSRSALFFFWYV